MIIIHLEVVGYLDVHLVGIGESKERSPCEDVGLSQFRSANGSINSQSFTIERGYKSGQGHRNNGGAEIW